MQKVFEHLVSVAAEDEEFRRRARYLEGGVRFGVGDDGFIARFFGGKLQAIIRDTVQTVPWDYEVTGSEADWERMARGEIELTVAVVPQFGSLVIRGNRIKFAADVRALVQLSRLLPEAAERAGLWPAPAPQPVPPAPADPWATRNEVVGRYVSVRGARTYYEAFGDPKADLAYIAIHTAGHDSKDFMQFGDAVAHTGYFIALDLPGHGKSWPLPGNTVLSSIPDMSQFIWELRVALGITVPTVVVGCSVGGNLVFQLATDHAADVAAVVSFQGADHTPTQPDEALALMDHPQVNPAYYLGGDRAISLVGSRTEQHKRDQLAWAVRIYCSLNIQSDLRAYSNFDHRDRTSAITAPCLLVRGTADWIVSEDMVAGTAKRLVNAADVQVEYPDGIGHFAPFEQPEEMATLVIAFLLRNNVIKNAA
jgi:pimeloyl-ACP methyl ester carboxylesterase